MGSIKLLEDVDPTVDDPRLEVGQMHLSGGWLEKKKKKKKKK